MTQKIPERLRQEQIALATRIEEFPFDLEAIIKELDPLVARLAAAEADRDKYMRQASYVADVLKRAAPAARPAPVAGKEGRT